MSQIVAMSGDGLGWEGLDIRVVQLDPVDLRGLPRITADQVEPVPLKFLCKKGEGILSLDELTSAPLMTQAGTLPWLTHSSLCQVFPVGLSLLIHDAIDLCPDRAQVIVLWVGMDFVTFG